MCSGGFDQPAKFNALSNAMLKGLNEAMRAAERDTAIRAIVLTGAGKGFCSGAESECACGDVR